MQQELLPEELRKQIPALYAQDKKSMDATVYCRFFHAYGQGVWYVTEFDGEDTCFGWAELSPGLGELGYFSLKELESLEASFNGVRIPELQAIERDIAFKQCRLNEIPELNERR